MSPNTPRHSAASAMENRRSRKNPSSSIGWSLRDSQARKLPRTTTLANPAPTTIPEVHPLVGPSMIAHNSRPRPAIDSSAPRGSGRLASGFFESGTRTTAPMNPAATMGTFTRKIDPHQNLDNNKTTGDRADGDTESDRPRPRPDGTGPLGRVPEDVVDDRQGCRDGQRGSCAHDGSTSDQ